MNTCVCCSRPEINGSCGFCTKEAKERVVRVQNMYSSYESYHETADKVRRKYGNKEYNVFMREYEIYQEAKKDGSEALDGYISNLMYRLKEMLNNNKRKVTDTNK